MLKRTQCKNYSKESKKPIYKRAWLGALAIVIVAGTTGCSDVDNSKEVNSGNVEAAQEVAQNDSENTIVENKVEDKVEDNIPAEYRPALRKANDYSDIFHMSKAKIYNQLTSEFGENFTAEVAQYAVDNADIDWKENALITAEFYQEQYQGNLAYTKEEIYDKLISEFEQFTPEEAQYAIDNLN